MTTKGPILYVGMADFDKPTLLIIGEPSGFRRLAQLIESRWIGDLSEAASEIKLLNIRLRLGFSDEAAGLERHGSDLLWNIASADAGTFADQIRQLADLDRPGHTYLEPRTGIQPIEVIASKGEYNPMLVFS